MYRMYLQVNEESGVEGSSEQALTVTQPSVPPGQQSSSDENEPSPSSQSTSEDENGSCSSEPSSSSISSNTSSSSCSSFEREIQAIFGPETSYAPTSFSLKTFKLVGDNVDKNVKPSDVRVDSQTKSLHYFQTYAVRDRIDLTSYDDTPVIDESKVDSTRLLPSESDHNKLTFLVARVLKQYMPFFEKFGAGLEKHIRHKFYEETGQKSEVVSYSLRNSCMA